MRPVPVSATVSGLKRGQFAACSTSAGQSRASLRSEDDGPRLPAFEQHVEQRIHAHQAREHGRPLRDLLDDALEAAVEIGARAQLAAHELERRDDLEPATRAVIADALRTAELLAAAAWQRLDGAASTAPHDYATFRSAPRPGASNSGSRFGKGWIGGSDV